MVSNSRSSSRWRAVRLTGVSTTTWQKRSPAFWLRTPLIPLPRRRKVFPLCVSAGGGVFAGASRGGDADLGGAVQRRNGDFAAEGSRTEGDRHLAMQVVVVALEHAMRLDVDL